MYAWLQRVWYGEARSGALLLPLAWIYGGLVRLRSGLYRSAWKRPLDVGRPVVVVGNMTVGGTGKTPLTLWLVEQLRARGLRPGIVLRGYGGGSRRPMLVDTASLATVVGDEALLLARRSGCPVAVGADRVAAARLLVGQGADLIVADDGLQHLRLKRDLEIVVMDGIRRFGNCRLLPAGPLREPLTRLESVDAIVVNGGQKPAAGVAMSLLPGAATALKSGMRRPLREFAGKAVHAVAAIGNPERFFDLLRAQGLRVIAHPLRDHQAIGREDIEFADQLPVFMTEKDAVKCESIAGEQHWYLPVEAVLGEQDGRELVELLLQRTGLRNTGRAR